MEYNKVYYGDAYCVKCKDKVNFEGEIRVADSGRRMAIGKCPQCGNKVNRILGKEPFQEKPINVPAPQPAVPMPPTPYATIKIYIDDSEWIADVTDGRRTMYAFQSFRAYSRKRVIKKAMQWLEAYEEIKLYKECK